MAISSIISSKNLTLNIGDVHTISVEVNPDNANIKNISWGVNGYGVATLEPKPVKNFRSRKIIAEGVGTVRISVTILEDRGKEIPFETVDYCYVTVVDLSKIQFSIYSDIKEAKITKGTKYKIGDNISIEEYRWMIAIMDNENKITEEWLGFASAILNNFEANTMSLYETIENQCHDWISCEQRCSNPNTCAHPNPRKDAVVAYRDGTSNNLQHQNRYDEMKAILDWTLAGNRIFSPEIKHWGGNNINNLFSTQPIP